jgi:tRNA 5-methylaminomethyl-2-thiouridine biosynthesis bifunctional protein
VTTGTPPRSSRWRRPSRPAGEFCFVDRERASQLAGWPVASGGWWFPGGGWVDPASLCRANLARHAAAITAHYGCEVAQIERHAELWHACDAGGRVIAEAPVLILANASDARRFAAAAHLPLRAARAGFASAGSHRFSAWHRRLPPRLRDAGNRRPALRRRHLCVDDEQTALREADHAENLAKLDFILPGYSKGIDRAALGGRVGFRPLSPDRLPMIGAIADAAAIDPARPSRPLAEMPRLPGLYLINGFGARGIVWSALAGELLACLITGAPLPLAEDLVDAVDPGRFPARAGRRLRQEDPQQCKQQTHLVRPRSSRGATGAGKDRFRQRSALPNYTPKAQGHPSRRADRSNVASTLALAHRHCEERSDMAVQFPALACLCPPPATLES